MGGIDTPVLGSKADYQVLYLLTLDLGVNDMRFLRFKTFPHRFINIEA